MPSCLAASGHSQEVPCDILPPGRYFFSHQERWPEFIDANHVCEPLPGNIDYMGTVTFMDSNGLEWVRGLDGKLERAGDSQVTA